MTKYIFFQFVELKICCLIGVDGEPVKQKAVEKKWTRINGTMAVIQNDLCHS